MGPVRFHVIQNMAKVGDDHSGLGPIAGTLVLLGEGVYGLTYELDVLQVHTGVRLIQHHKIGLLGQQLNHLRSLDLAPGESTVDVPLGKGFKVHLPQDRRCIRLGIDDLDKLLEP